MYITYRYLLEGLKELTEQQLDMTVTVSAGCDENGNAEFFAADALTIAINPDIEAAADGVLEPEQPVILFEEEVLCVDAL
jgi:hypothetical protein